MVTMVDSDLRTLPFNGHPAYPMWVPKVQGRQVDRLSGSMINVNMPGVFASLDHPLGLVLAPREAQACLWCSYPFDAGSNGPVPCRPSSYPPEQFADMMRQPQGGSSGVTAVYNEVVLHDDSQNTRPGCYSSAMPRIVEAVFVLRDEDASFGHTHRDRFISHFSIPASRAPVLLKYTARAGFSFLR